MIGNYRLPSGNERLGFVLILGPRYATLCPDLWEDTCKYLQVNF